MIRSLISAAAGLALVTTAGCVGSPSGPPVNAAVSAERLSEHVRILSADSFQGRRPTTDGERMTLEYLQAQYEAMGLEPGGPDGQWRQPVTLTRFTLQPGSRLAATTRDGQTVDLVAMASASLRASYGDGQARIEAAPVVFAGYGVSAPEQNWDDYEDVDVRGAVVLVLAGEPDDARFNGVYPSLYGLDLYKTEEAFRRGAVAVLTVVEAGPGELGGYSGGAVTSIVGVENIEATGFVASDVLADWMTDGGLDHAAIMAEALTDGFRARPIAGVRLELKASEAIQTVPTYNLLARLPGTERPDETIIVSAHWDHVGAQPAAGGDGIFNGAWDNASGTAGVLELARVLSEEGPRERSIVFAHMAAEEMGLLGSYFYAENPVWPLETTVADLNIDMLPLSPPTRDVAIFGYGQNSLEDDLAALAAAAGRVVTDDGRPEEGFYYRSDHFPFALAGVPALMPWHGVDWDEGGREVGLPAYQLQWATYYHQPADEWSPELDWRSAVENLELLHRLAAQLADGEQWPDWKPTSEFGRARAASDAARQ